MNRSSPGALGLDPYPLQGTRIHLDHGVCHGDSALLSSAFASSSPRRVMTAVASTGRVALLASVALALVSATLGCSLENSTSQNSALHRAAPQHNTGDPVVVAAGDITTCYDTGDEATARLLSNIGGTVLTLGHNAYKDGTPEE